MQHPRGAMNSRLPQATSHSNLSVRAAAVAASIAVLLPAGCVLHTHTHEVVTAEVLDEPVTDFEPVLAPYGTWLVTTTCGRGWRPHADVVGVGFVPYRTGGEWVSTDHGWSFESEWEWGWAVYHYGRWCPDPGEGWVWVPGTVWAPAWVEWRTSGAFVGWAPLPPPGVVIVHDHWTFVDHRHFHESRVVHHALPPERVRHVHEQSRPTVPDVVVHGPTTWPAGPSARDISRQSGKDIRPVHVVPPKPGTIRRATARPVKKAPPVRHAPGPR